MENEKLSSKILYPGLSALLLAGCGGASPPPETTDITPVTLADDSDELALKIEPTPGPSLQGDLPYSDTDEDFVNDSDELALGMTPGLYEEWVDLPEGRFQFHLRIGDDKFISFDGDNYDPYLLIRPETLSCLIDEINQIPEETPSFGEKIVPQFDFNQTVWKYYLNANPELGETGFMDAFNFRPEGHDERIVYMHQDFFHDIFPLEFLYDKNNYDPLEGLELRQTLDGLGVTREDLSEYTIEQLSGAGMTAIFYEELLECVSTHHSTYSDEQMDNHSRPFKQQVFRDVLEGRLTSLFGAQSGKLADPIHIRSQIESWPWFTPEMIDQTEKYFDQEFPGWKAD